MNRDLIEKFARHRPNFHKVAPETQSNKPTESKQAEQSKSTTVKKESLFTINSFANLRG